VIVRPVNASSHTVNPDTLPISTIDAGHTRSGVIRQGHAGHWQVTGRPRLHTLHPPPETLILATPAFHQPGKVATNWQSRENIIHVISKVDSTTPEMSIYPSGSYKGIPVPGELPQTIRKAAVQ